MDLPWLVNLVNNPEGTDPQEWRDHKHLFGKEALQPLWKSFDLSTLRLDAPVPDYLETMDPVRLVEMIKDLIRVGRYRPCIHDFPRCRTGGAMTQMHCALFLWLFWRHTVASQQPNPRIDQAMAKVISLSRSDKPEPRTRDLIVLVLGALGSNACVDRLCEMMQHDKDGYIRWHACCALGKFKLPYAAEKALDLLEHGTPNAAWKAARILISGRHEGVADRLEDIAATSHPHARLNASRILHGFKRISDDQLLAVSCPERTHILAGDMVEFAETCKFAETVCADFEHTAVYHPGTVRRAIEVSRSGQGHGSIRESQEEAILPKPEPDRGAALVDEWWAGASELKRVSELEPRKGLPDTRFI